MAKAKAQEPVQEPLKAVEPENARLKPIQSGIINAPFDVMIGSTILVPKAQEIRTGISLNIPEGGLAVVTLCRGLVELSKIRLASGAEIVEDSKEVVLHLDNIGRDGFMVRKGIPLAKYIIFVPQGAAAVSE